MFRIRLYNPVAFPISSFFSVPVASTDSGTNNIEIAAPFKITGHVIASGDTATEWHLVMTATLLAMLPPLAVVLTMQRWFVRGLVDAEK